jgi:predicted TIM-barrel fold metal-dependent hydrolase
MSSSKPVKVFDCDTHFWQPIEIWEDYIEPKYRAAVRNALTDGGIGLQAAAPAVRAKLAAAMEIKGADHVKERLEWMDGEGIDACLIYPSGAGFLCYLEDSEVAAAACRGANKWAAAFAGGAPDRLFPCMLLPWYDPARALEEFKVAKDLGFRFAFSAPTPSAERRWSDRSYDPIWAAMESNGIIMTFHEFTRIPAGGKSNLVARDSYKDQYPMMYLCGHTVEIQLAVMDIILGGVCERFPKLNIGFVECHAAWLQGWLEMLDSVWERPLTAQKRAEAGLKDTRMPSQVFKDQCWLAAFPDDRGLDLLVEKLGSACLTITSDYPHPQTTYGMVARFDKSYPNFDAKTRRNVLGGNIVRLLEERGHGAALTRSVA